MAAALAQSRLEELKKRYEENPRRFFAPLANEYRKAGDLELAIALCQEHLGEQPGNMNGQVVYGQALFDAGRFDDAETTFATALSLDPENLIALRHLGDIARAKNDVGKAIEWYTRVLDADPRNDEILAFIGELKEALAAASASAPTPVVTPAVPSAAEIGDQPTVELAQQGRPAAGTPTTPFAPVAAVAAPAELPPRQSLSLLDVSLDVGSEPETAVTDWASALPAAPTDPAGDVGLSDMTVEGPFGAAPAPESTSLDEPPTRPAGGELAPEAGLAWQMGAVDLGVSPGEEPMAAPAEVAAAPETPQVFVTETMAELYLQQGLRNEALKVYRQLAELRPDDASIRERISSLDSSAVESLSTEATPDASADRAPGLESLVQDSDHPTAAVPSAGIADAPEFELLPSVQSLADPTALPVVEPPPARAVASARAFFASLAQRRPIRGDGTTPAAAPSVASAQERSEPFAPSLGSIDSLFGTTATDGSDDAVGLALATAVGAVDAGAPIRGKPTQPAASELSLDSVFRGESAKRVSGPISRQSEVLNFDQFFATVEPPPPAETAPDPGAAPSAPSAPSADDAEFQSWLQILKGK